MAGRYRTSKETNRSRFYILLSIIFVIVMIKWGVPFFVNTIAGNGGTRQNQDKDIIPPQSPVLSALPEATNSAEILVEGYTEAEASLDILINDNIVLVEKAGEDGSFSAVAPLTAGSNRVNVRATDEAGNISSSEVKIVIFDNKPIELTITSPKDGAEFFGKNNQVIDIAGEINKVDSEVIINNSFVLIDKDGKFSHRYQLANGNNEIKVLASDTAGNTAEKMITILYTP